MKGGTANAQKPCVECVARASHLGEAFAVGLELGRRGVGDAREDLGREGRDGAEAHLLAASVERVPDAKEALGEEGPRQVAAGGPARGGARAKAGGVGPGEPRLSGRRLCVVTS